MRMYTPNRRPPRPASNPRDTEWWSGFIVGMIVGLIVGRFITRLIFG